MTSGSVRLLVHTSLLRAQPLPSAHSALSTCQAVPNSLWLSRSPKVARLLLAAPSLCLPSANRTRAPPLIHWVLTPSLRGCPGSEHQALSPCRSIFAPRGQAHGRCSVVPRPGAVRAFGRRVEFPGNRAGLQFGPFHRPISVMEARHSERLFFGVSVCSSVKWGAISIPTPKVWCEDPVDK